MFAAIRRVGNTLLGVGAILVTLSVASSVSFYCGLGQQGCLGAALTAPVFETQTFLASGETMTAESTVPYIAPGWTITDTSNFAEGLGISLIFVAVLILIVLECLELKYLRTFIQKRRRA